MDTNDTRPLPRRLENIEALDEFMASPSPALVDQLSAIKGDILILGVGGKMGPSLARLAVNAAPDKRIIGVARFCEPQLERRLNENNVETIRGDLLERDFLSRLPEAQNVIFMAGRKFGSHSSTELSWAMNAYLPALVAERFNKARIVVFSTGCVYPFVPVISQGASEGLPPDPPGEYAQSCVGRERMFEYFSGLYGTRGALIRLNYAIDMRYGVLFDIAVKVMEGKEIDVTTGHVNVIWQGDANARVLQALAHCSSPYNILNISGPETVSVRWAANTFGEMLDRAVNIVGHEADSGWLTNTAKSNQLFGYPAVPLQTMMEWTADWVTRKQPSLGKKTAFEVRDGKY